MNRPACIRHIDQHVARRRVTPFRLRAVDAARLLDYMEQLEARVANAQAPRLSADTAEVVEAMAAE